MPRTTARLRFCAAIIVAVPLAGCDIESFDDAERRFNAGAPPAPAPDPTPNPTPNPTPPPAGFNPVFSEIQANVFTPDCATSGCHDAGAAASLDLRDGFSYANLVGVPSSQQAGIQRIAPNNPDGSYLVQKLEGSAASGQQMPPGGALPQAEIDVIRQWITDGAIDDTATPPAAPVQVTSLSPQPNATLTSAPTQIVAGFSRELDATTVNAMTFVVDGSGGDGTFGDGNEVAVTAASITVPGANPQTAIFDLAGVNLADDTYRVRLLGNGGSIILDLDANALDGEFSGVLPSGNGSAGGDFVTQFSIATPSALDMLQASVFTPNCATAGCHSGPAGGALPTGMDLSDADSTHAALVGVDSTQAPGTDRVNPGNPDLSYLVMKIEGQMGIVGTPMPPPGRTPLSAQQIADIRQWITDGALR